MSVTYHHLGVSPHVHQHHYIVSLVHAHRQQVGGDVRSHMASNQRAAIHVSVGVDTKVKVCGANVQGGGGPLPFVKI